MHRQENICGAAQIFQRQFNEQGFTAQSLPRLLRNGCVILRIAANGHVEDGGVGCQAGHLKGVDIALQCAAVQHRPRDVVDPQALAHGMQNVGRVHGHLLKSDFTAQHTQAQDACKHAETAKEIA